MNVRVRLLQNKANEILALLDEGQDFEALFALWCEQDDAFCEDRISEKEWMDIVTFLRCHGVKILDSETHDLADYY